MARNSRTVAIRNRKCRAHVVPELGEQLVAKPQSYRGRKFRPVAMTPWGGE